MNSLCWLFGHVPAYGYSKIPGSGYFKIHGGVIDGIGREHCPLTTECERCGERYQVGMVHRLAPAVPESATPTPKPYQVVDPKCWHKEIDDEGICKECGARAAISLEGMPIPPAKERAAVGMLQDGNSKSETPKKGMMISDSRKQAEHEKLMAAQPAESAKGETE